MAATLNQVNYSLSGPAPAGKLQKCGPHLQMPRPSVHRYPCPIITVWTEKGTVTGLAVIAAEPKELTFVYIDGLINPEQLAGLGGQFGIPKVEVHPDSNPAVKGDSK